jgi:hypothetical protein
VGGIRFLDKEFQLDAYETWALWFFPVWNDHLEAASKRFEVHFERLPKSSPYVGTFHRGFSHAQKVSSVLAKFCYLRVNGVFRCGLSFSYLSHHPLHPSAIRYVSEMFSCFIQ